MTVDAEKGLTHSYMKTRLLTLVLDITQTLLTQIPKYFR